MTNKLHDRGAEDLEELADTIEELAEDPGLTIGTHAEDNARRSETGEAASINLAYILAIHVLGKGVPQRDPLRPTMDRNEEKYARMMRHGLAQILDDQLSIERMLHLVGQAIKGDVQEVFGDKNHLLPNAPATIEAKSTSAGKGDAPLIDTGQLKQSIDYQVDRE